ncbi:MAG: hypothetical protein CL917_05430 [Deltaproteobacteria bacterium]|nr:hypothetical protein [Deltaproteobacteria bacterium]
MKERLDICNGKHCRKYAKANKKLAELAEDHIEVKRSRCLKVCKKTPVIVLRHGKKKEVFQKIRDGRSQLALVRYLETGKMSKRLKEHLHAKS